MGAYLSRPVTTKYSESGKNDSLVYGATAMQGWRVSQEDAHNCILNFDDDCSYFAVYDGHGGAEVSEYASKMFPEFLKASETWSKARVGQALEDAFLKFDEHLLKPEVLEELKMIAGIKKDDTNEEETETDEDKALLYEEACLPLEDVLKKYGIRLRFGGDEKFVSPKLSSRKGNNNAEIKKESTSPKSGLNHNKNGDPIVDHPSPPSSPGDCAVESDNKNEKTPSLKRARNGTAKKLYENSDVVGCQETPVVESIVAGDDWPSSKRAKPSNDDCKAKKETNELPDSLCSSTDVSKSSENVKENGYASNDAVDKRNTDNSFPSSKEETKENVMSDDETPSANISNNESENKPTPKTFAAKFIKQTVAKLFPKTGVGSAVEGTECVEEVSEEEETEDEEYRNEVEEEEEDSSGETEEDSVEEDEIVDEEIEEGEELIDEEEEEEEEEEDDMFPVPSGETPGVDSGTTACVAVIKGNTIYVANAGDSRCVLCRKDDVAVDLSADHKPEDLTERERIEKAGGTITGDGRVNGGLNLSRAIGDHFYKRNTDLPLRDQMITALPDIRAETLLSTDKFLVLACDGIWNSMSSQEVVDFISLRLKNGLPPSKVCEQLCDSCLAPSTAGDGTGCDNMTAIIVNFQNKAESYSTANQQHPSPTAGVVIDGSADSASTVDNHSTEEAT